MPDTLKNHGPFYEERIQTAIKLLRKSDLPFVVEFAGLPRSGKTTCVESLADLLKRSGCKTGRITERASTCPISNKLRPDFNAWTLTSYIKQFLELKDSGTEIIVSDRGPFDAIAWLRFMMNTKRCTQELFNELSNCAHSKLWWSHQLAILVFKLTTDMILRREKIRRLSRREGTIIRKEPLDAFRLALEEEIELCNKETKLVHTLEVGEFEISEVKHKVAEIVIVALENKAKSNKSSLH